MLVMQIPPWVTVTIHGPQCQKITLTSDQLPTPDRPKLPVYDTHHPVQIGRVLWGAEPAYPSGRAPPVTFRTNDRPATAKRTHQRRCRANITRANEMPFGNCKYVHLPSKLFKQPLLS